MMKRSGSCGISQRTFRAVFWAFGVAKSAKAAARLTRRSAAYAVQQVPQGISARVDTIDTPMGNGIVTAPSLLAPRNWLKLAPMMQQRGNVIQIAEHWMASGKNGWNPDVYSEKTALGGGGPGSGLSIGSLQAASSL